MIVLAKFLIDESVLPGKRLDILSHLSYFLGLQLRQLSLLVDLLPQIDLLQTKRLDLLLALEELALIVVLLADNDAHLVLHVAELEALLLELGLNLDQFLGLLVELALHLVEVAVEHGQRLLEVIDLLVLGLDLALVRLDVVHEHCTLVLATSASRDCLLKPLQQLILSVIKVLDQGTHALHLSAQILIVLLLSR